MANEFYALMGRMRYITRWGLMRNTFSENISEHSHMTAVLAHALALIRRDLLTAAPWRRCTTTLRKFSPATCPRPSNTTIRISRPPTKRWSALRATVCWICSPPSCVPATPIMCWRTTRSWNPSSRPRTSCPPTSSVWRSRRQATQNSTPRRSRLWTR